MIGTKKKEEKYFELSLCVRDNDGKPTGKYKTIEADSGDKLAKFWHRHGGDNKRKKHKVSDAAKSDDVQTALKEASSYTEKIRKKRRLED